MLKRRIVILFIDNTWQEIDYQVKSGLDSGLELKCPYFTNDGRNITIYHTGFRKDMPVYEEVDE